MPVARNFYWNNVDAARRFIRSRAGILMHELSHYVALNVDGPVGGHIIVSNSDRGGGAFVINNPSLKRLNRVEGRHAFGLAAGSMAELYFCNQTNIDSAGADIDAYRCLPGVKSNLSAESVASIWQNDYMAKIEGLAGCIDENYDRCMGYITTNCYLIGQYHVIPSWALRPPRFRWLGSWLDEIVWTVSKAERIKALGEYLDQRRRPSDRKLAV